MTSLAEMEKIAVRFASPCLCSVSVFCVAWLSLNAIDETKLFGLVVSVDEIVRDVAVEDNVTLVPATKFADPNGV